jgi:hypothetical protein
MIATPFSFFGTARRLIKAGGVVMVLVLILSSGLASSAPVAAAGSSYIGLVADDNGSVHVFETGTNTVLGTVAIPDPDHDNTNGDCSVASNGIFGFVTDFDNEIWVIDLTQSPPVLASGINPIPISNPGEDIAVTPDGQYLVITDGTGGDDPCPISVVDIASRTEVSTKTVAPNHCAVDTLSDGSVLVVSYDSSTAYRLTIDSAGNLNDTGETLPVEYPNNIYGAPNAKTGFVVEYWSKEIRIFGIPGLDQLHTLSLPDEGVCAVMHPDGRKIYVRTDKGYVLAYAFDPNTGAPESVPFFIIPVAECISYFGMDQMAITPDGRQLYVPEGNLIKVYNAVTGEPLYTISDHNFGVLTGVSFGISPSVIQAPGLSQWGTGVLVVLFGGTLLWVNRRRFTRSKTN